MRGWIMIPLLLLTASSILMIPSVSADTGYDGDLGCMYSMEVMFIFNGENANRVIWDFGDGTDEVEAMDVKHKFPSEGVYYVTQTAINGSGDDLKESVAVYRVEIMGYPEIHFDSHGGSEVETIEQDMFNVPAIKPEDPVKEGFSFNGWYLDADLKEPMDWTMPVKTDMVLHAGWLEAPAQPEKPSEPPTVNPPQDEGQPDDEDDSRHGNDTDSTLLALVLTVSIVLVVLATFVMMRRT